MEQIALQYVETLQSLNYADLQMIKLELQKIMDAKKETKKIIYTHECFGSSNYHFRKYKHWSKELTGIDETQTNGYAFMGNFLKCDKENLVNVGSYIVEVCSTFLQLFYVTENGLELKAEGRYSNLITFIQEVKDISGF